MQGEEDKQHQDPEAWAAREGRGGTSVFWEGQGTAKGQGGSATVALLTLLTGCSPPTAPEPSPEREAQETYVTRQKGNAGTGALWGELLCF